MEIIKLNKQGFCYGVTRAIKIAVEASTNNSYPKPIYLLGDIVHNVHISNYLDELGIITIKGDSRYNMLDLVPDYSTIIFSAHGVSDKVRLKAANKHLTIIDATCPYVEKTFNLVKEECDKGDIIFYIGKTNHPETEATLSLSDHVYLVNDEIYQKDFNNQTIKVANQTTMSKYDVSNTYLKLKQHFNNIEMLDMICKVTETRQNELMDALKKYNDDTLFIIIGDANSNNSTKLYELAEREKHEDAIFIEQIDDLDLSKIRHYKRAVIASGTSTPLSIINEVVDVLNNIDSIKERFIKTKLKSSDYK